MTSNFGLEVWSFAMIWTMDAGLNHFVSCGYLIGCQTRLPIEHFPELAGKPVISIAHDIAPHLPDTWCFNQEENDAVAAILQKWQLSSADFPELRKYCLEQVRANEIVWPSYFSSLDTARNLLSKFFQQSECQLSKDIIGLGVLDKHAKIILDEHAKAAAGNENLYSPECELLQQGKPCAAGGEILGFEIACFDQSCGFSCSWLCNYLQRDAKEKLSIDLGEFGLIRNLKDAEQMADYCNLPETAAEPGLWLPVMLVKYGP
jgi:hypothetical protein